MNLPANLNTIREKAFNGCTSLTYINTEIKTPITIDESTFNDVTYNKCELFVPDSSTEAYRQATVWSKFNHITDGTVVLLNKSGSLSSKIDSNKRINITHLKVVGPIDIFDIQYIREMAGCWFEWGKEDNGKLKYLDLHDAQLVGSDYSIDIYIKDWLQDQQKLECTAKIEPDGNDFSNLFRNVSKLNTVIMPSYLTTTGRGTFMDSPLSSITLPKSLTTIGEYAFYNCSLLETIELPTSVTIISHDAFANCSNLRYISLPSNIKYIGEYTFSNSGIREITLPQQVTEITNNMFERCQNLEHIYLHDGLKSIGDYAFQDCNSLGGITLPNSVTKIGKGCFAHCDYLKEGVTLSDAITEIPEEAFADCGYLHEIKLPAELKRIGYRAFCGSPYIGSFGGLKIPSKVTEIAPEAFYKSFQDIEVLELPASLKTVGDYAFADCSAKVIYAYMSEPFPLKDADFYSHPRSECKLYVPKGCAKKYRQAEIWKEFDIEEMDGTGIEGVTNDSTATEVARYDANGNLLAAPAKGLNIVRYSDGTVKKIMVE